MRRGRTLHALAWLALVSLGVLSAGCAARLLHRGDAASAAVPATEAAAAKPTRAEKQHADKHAPEAALPEFFADPLAEAHERMATEPAEPWWPTRAGDLEAAAGHAAAAENALHTALARDSAYAPALTRLSRLYYQQGRNDEAVRLLEPVRDGRVELDGAARSAVLAGLALHQAALGRDDDARSTLAMLAHGDRDEAAGVAAFLALRGRSADTVVKLTQAAVKAAPASAANHNNLGIALLRSADPEAAAHEFERAIELDPSLPGPYYNLAILERWYRLDHVAAAQRFAQYWTRSHADPDSLYAELGHGSPTPVAEEGRDK